MLVGHGSRSAVGVAEMQALGRLVAAALPEVAVEVGFLELAAPAAPLAIDALADRGCVRVAVLPLMLLGAGHAKSDAAALVVEGRRRHPDLDLCLGSPLGLARDLVAQLGQALDRAGGAGLPLVVVARGTSDPDANGDAHKAARLLAEWNRSPWVGNAFSGVTWPSLPAVLDGAYRLGHRRLALAFWFLCHGALIDRARQEIAAFTNSTGVEVVDAGYLGPTPAIVPTVVERYHQALMGSFSVNCDLCAYRAPWPGLEDRVGQPVGVGHSHLAADHRRAGHRQ